MKEPDKQKRRRNVLLLAAAAVVLVIVFLLFREPILGLLGLNAAIPDGPLVDSDQSGLAAFLPDEEMGYSRIDFTNAILGQAREEKEHIVLEQDVLVDTEISNALANISLFRKTKTVHSQGTGQYTVDMSCITDESIAVDMDERTVTVTVPHTVLHAIVVDAENTTFEETEHAIFGFGDIKLTQEQQQLVETSIQDAMRDKLDTPELYARADEIGCLQIAEIFQPLVSAVAEEFVVQVVMP